MNERQQSELRALREEQLALVHRLAALEERLARFEHDTESSATVDELPPPVPTMPGHAPEFPARPSLASAAAMANSTADAANPQAPATASTPTEPPPTPPTLPPPIPGNPPPPPPPRESLEVRIGSTWLVRIGVVVVLTALAFFGDYLYHNIVPHLGRGAKVALLYVGAGALTGAGAWLERSRQAREQPRLRQYAQVVFAGGLSAIYYVTYVAHYFENLRVINSALLAGALLLAWTAFMVLLADRRNSETLATVAILLAYYTAAINDGVAGFTLFSNLALSAGAVFLLRRHLWRVFPFASLLATFGSYAFWTYYHSYLGWRGDTLPPHAQHGPGGFWIESSFLLVYWALFTWVVFTAKDETLPPLRRANFAALNNGAFYLLVTWLVLGEGSGWFWKWSLGFGVALLVLAEGCRRRDRAADGQTGSAYLLQGVLAITVGFLAYFSGWHLSVVLAAEAVVLLAASGQRRSGLLLGCSLLAAALSFGWSALGFEDLHPDSWPSAWIAPLGVGALLVGAACLAEFYRKRHRTLTSDTPPLGGLAFAAWFHALLGSATWLWLIANGATDDARIGLFAGSAVALTASVYGLRLAALPVYAQGFLAAALLDWLLPTAFGYGGHDARGVALGTTLVLLIFTFALGQWWRRLPGRTLWTPGALSRFFSTGDAVVATGAAWLELSSRLERWHGAAFTLAAGWSVFAACVFVTGLLLRQRIYRWLGLFILAVTGVHLVVFDIMELDSLGKAVSFFALAVVLLTVGFLYNKYQDKFRELL